MQMFTKILINNFFLYKTLHAHYFMLKEILKDCCTDFAALGASQTRFLPSVNTSLGILATLLIT